MVKNKALTDNNNRLIRNHYDSIDGLRVIAAIGITIMHIQANANYEIDSFVFGTIIPFFANFVFLFMIISAFGVCCGYYEKFSKGMITPKEFYQKRYSKILPCFALLVCIDLILSPSKEAIIEAFANITLVFGLLPNADISVIGVGWFLGTVFVFYMLFPFFCYLIESKKRAWLALVIAVLYNVMCVIYFFDSNHVVEGMVEKHNFLFSSMYFMAGCMIYIYRDKIAKYINKFRWIYLALVAIITVSYFFVSDKHTSVKCIWLMIMFSCFLMYAISVKSVILSNKITKFLSSVSMEIYLCHMVIFRLVEKLNLNYLVGTGWFSYIIASILVVIGSVIFSVCAKKFIALCGNALNKVNASNK